MSTLIRMLCVSAFAVVISAGCATNSRTVRTETSTYPTGGAYHTESVPAQRTTVVEQETDTSGGGVISGTVNVLGEVVALPFRAAGALASAVF
jgi:hypothetical protein